MKKTLFLCLISFLLIIGRAFAALTGPSPTRGEGTFKGSWVRLFLSIYINKNMTI